MKSSSANGKKDLERIIEECLKKDIVAEIQKYGTNWYYVHDAVKIVYAEESN